MSRIKCVSATSSLLYFLLLLHCWCIFSLGFVQSKRQYIRVQCPSMKSLVYRFNSVTLVGNGMKHQAGQLENVIRGNIVLSCGSEQGRNNTILISFANSRFEQYRGMNRSRKYRK